MINTSDKNIIKTAEKLGIKVFDKRAYENEVTSYNYIVIRKGSYIKNNCCSYTRSIKVCYVFDGEQKIEDKEIVKRFEEIGLKFLKMETDDFQVGNTNKWVDMNTYIFERVERG